MSHAALPLAVAAIATVAEPPGESAPMPPVDTREAFDLICPIQRPGHAPIDILRAEEPALHHKADYERIADPGEATIAIIAALTGVDPAHVSALMPFDSAPISEWIQGRLNMQLWQPKRDANGAEMPLAEQLRDHPLSLTIPLDHPVTHGASTITQLTVKAPTLGAAVGLGKLTTTADQTAMMIAKLTDVPYPVARRLRLVDVAKIEAFIAPFYSRGPRTPKAPA
jgi:Phage tail assembly chaperone proteins, E, or 41 or 14